MRLELHRDTEGFQSLQSEWNDLLRRSVSNVLFLTWEWQQSWWDAFGAGRDMHLMAMRDDSGSLAAIVPLFAQQTAMDPTATLPAISLERPTDSAGTTSQRTVHLIGGSEVSDYLDVIAPLQQHHQTCATLLDALADEDWQALDLRSLPASSPTASAIASLARGRGWEVQQAREDFCPVLELPASWEAYLGQVLNKKQRHELRRKMRRAEQQVRVEWQWAQARDWEESLDTFIHLHRASAPDKELFMDQVMEGFFRCVARRAQQEGWLRLSVLRFNGQAVASYLCFDYGDDRLVYNSGFDLTAYADLSPGIVLLGYMIGDAIQRGCRRFDFLQGEERYKYELGANNTEVTRLFIRR